MSPKWTIVFFFPLFILCCYPSLATVLAPIRKDHSRPLYSISVYLKTPPQPTSLLLDLGASFTWVDCTSNYTSSTYHSIPCNSSLCTSLHSLACSNCFSSPGPGCANDSCALFPENSVTRKSIIAQALVDSLSLPITNGRYPGGLGAVPEFVLSCSTSSLLKGLIEGVTGLAGLGRSNISIPAQVSNAYSSPYIFALCLSGSPSASGLAFFGSGGPYFFLPSQIDLSKFLIYTPLLVNPVGSTVITYAGHPSDEYFVGLTSIKVNGKAVQLNQTALAIDDNGLGGTKLSTVTPYTTLQSSIYKAFVEAFVSESAALNLSQTAPAEPFSVCYSADDVPSTRVGPAVPTIDLVMHSEDVFWRIFGSNSMVRISREDADVWCLGFVDGGDNPTTSVVIGGHQMEDNLLQFDLESNRFGFTSSVLVHGTMCANFNFTTNNGLR